MKTAYLFHDISCCLTDCMVRACTCGVEAVQAPDAPNSDAALRQAAKLVGAVRADGASIEWLSGTVDEEDGVLHLHFLTRRGSEDDEEDDT